MQLWQKLRSLLRETTSAWEPWQRGGRFEHGLLAREPQNMFDGNMDTFGNILTSGGTKGGWREGGAMVAGRFGCTVLDRRDVYIF